MKYQSFVDLIQHSASFLRPSQEKYYGTNIYYSIKTSYNLITPNLRAIGIFIKLRAKLGKNKIAFGGGRIRIEHLNK